MEYHQVQGVKDIRKYFWPILRLWLKAARINIYINNGSNDYVLCERGCLKWQRHRKWWPNSAVPFSSAEQVFQLCILLLQTATLLVQSHCCFQQSQWKDANLHLLLLCQVRELKIFNLSKKLWAEPGFGLLCKLPCCGTNKGLSYLIGIKKTQWLSLDK